MKNCIQLSPSGRRYTAEKFDSVLEAGLRAGINLPYGCGNGNCGECKARLLKGRITRIRHHDYMLTEAEKLSGGFLMCSNAAKEDIVVEVREATRPQDVPFQQITAKVRKIRTECDAVTLLQLRCPRSTMLRFLAGQRVRLGGVDGMPEGEYPIASCPCDGLNLYFHIPKIDNDAFSRFIFETPPAPGDRIHLRGPKGDFLLDEDLITSTARDVVDMEIRPHLFIAWHTGFAPIKSLIEHLISLEDDSPIHLYRIEPDPEQVYLDKFGRSWQDAMDNLSYCTLPQPFALHGSRAEAERLLQEIIAHHPDIADMTVYLAGPSTLVTAAKRMFFAAGLARDQLKTQIECLGEC